MKNNIQLILLLISINLKAQTSNFYGNYNINKNTDADVILNNKTDVSADVNQTIGTINYEQLATENTQKEVNRLSSLKYSNELLRQRALEVANDPNKFDYGIDIFTKRGTQAKFGLKKLFISKENYMAFLYQNHQSNNQSEDGIITEIELHGFQIEWIE